MPAAGAIRYAALLRGVNVGGKNKIAMKSLGALFTDAGCQHVQTYIQSGNVVFSATPRKAAPTAAIASAIEKQYGFKTAILLRTLPEMEQIEAANPYLRAGVPEDRLHVVFLATKPTPEQVALLDPNRSGQDQFTVSGKEIFLYLPNGAADTKLTNAYFDSKLKTVSSGRNWRTFKKLIELLRLPPPSL